MAGEEKQKGPWQENLDRWEENDQLKNGESGMSETIRWYITLTNRLIEGDPWISVLRVLEQLVNCGPLRSAEQVLWILGGAANFRNMVRGNENRRRQEGIPTLRDIKEVSGPFRFNLREVEDEVLIRNPHAKTYRWTLMGEKDQPLESAGSESESGKMT